MSLTYSTNVNADELLDFLLDEHAKGTGIPVHPFSVVNATMSSFNGSLGITDGSGTLFVDDGQLTAYGIGNHHDGMLRALRRCAVEITFVW